MNNNNDNNLNQDQDADQDPQEQQACRDAAAELLERIREQQEQQAQQTQRAQLPANRLEALIQQSKIHSPLLATPRTEVEQENCPQAYHVL